MSADRTFPAAVRRLRLAELGRLGAQLVIQRAIEDECVQAPGDTGPRVSETR